jgi:serine/threonine protein phosphatase PrpC
MTLGQVAVHTDTGRKRRHNEDAYVCEPPLFAIADGMGGAQAGEVASGLAAGVLRERSDVRGGSDKRLLELIHDANRLVYQRAGEDSELTGMGTTLTVALVEPDRVRIGHVGDSRAYLIRDGALEQLTEDHSLVAELTRAGKLSEEEAETHPQRSVITRALGTDPDVDADTFTVETQPGDVFLICSDGLTDMVDEQTILDTVQKHRRKLDAAAKALVKAANRGGGEDNITVILFEISDVAERTLEHAASPAPEEEVEEEEAEEEEAEEEDTLSGIEKVPVVGAGAAAEERLDDWTRDDGGPQTVLERPVLRVPARRSRRRLYVLAGVLLVLVLVGLGVFGLSQSHFVGAQKDGRVAVFQGVPWDIAGIHLYRTVFVSNLLAAQLTQRERQQLFDHDLRSYGSAKDAIRRYEQLVEP